MESIKSLFFGSCKNCEKLENEIATLKEAQNLGKIISCLVEEEMTAGHSIAQTISQEQGCSLICSLSMLEDVLKQTDDQLFSFLNRFYVFISRIVAKHNGMIDKFNLSEVYVFFASDDPIKDCYLTCEDVLRDTSDLACEFVVLLLPQAGTFATGILGDPKIRLDYTHINLNLFKSKGILNHFASSKESSLLIDDNEKSSFEPFAQNYHQLDSHNFEDFAVSQNAIKNPKNGEIP